MKDCWIKEPEKRIEFSAVSKRLKNPYHNYDVPPSSDSEEGTEQPETNEQGNLWFRKAAIQIWLHFRPH